MLINEYVAIEQTSASNTSATGPNWGIFHGKNTVGDSRGNILGFLLPAQIYLKNSTESINRHNSILSKWETVDLVKEFDIETVLETPYYPFYDVVNKTYRQARLITEIEEKRLPHQAYDSLFHTFYWELDDGTKKIFHDTSESAGIVSGEFYPLVGCEYNPFAESFSLHQAFCISENRYEEYYSDSQYRIRQVVSNYILSGIPAHTMIQSTPSLNPTISLIAVGGNCSDGSRFYGQPYGRASYPDISPAEEFFAHSIEANSSYIPTQWVYGGSGRTEYYANGVRRSRNEDI